MNKKDLIKIKLPDKPGVYMFKDYKGRPLYIGRATFLNDRVKSYFSDDIIVSRGPRILDMLTKAKKITFEITDSVLEAIILETSLIKKYQPYYNVAERDDKSAQYVIITDEPWPRVFLARSRDYDLAVKENTLPYKVKRNFGPYPNGLMIKDALKVIRKLFPFKDKKSFDSRHDNFYRSIGRSPKDTDENSRQRYRRMIDNFILFFEGKKKKIQKILERDMHNFAKDRLFEQAQYIKKLLFALDHINDMALLKHSSQLTSDSLNSTSTNRRVRFEAYDIAHLSGTNVVGAMVVSENGQLNFSEYRKFKISIQVNNDLASLSEILSRRLNHTEWAYPDIIIVDGNENHQKLAENILKSRRISIPVVAVTKDNHHKAVNLLGHPEIIKKYQKEIIALNVEAHRFTINFHRKNRNRSVYNSIH